MIEKYSRMSMEELAQLIIAIVRMNSNDWQCQIQIIDEIRKFIRMNP